MKKLGIWLGVLALVAACWSVSLTPAAGETFTFIAPDGREVTGTTEGTTTKKLSAPGDYDWWHGCSPTSAGMMMGYYDVNGYESLTYGNLVPGGAAENSTFGAGPYLANNAIASSGHIADFWVAYLDPGPDPLASGRTIPNDFDCLADFMGTSQAAVGNVDGSTTFYYYTNGAAFHDYNALGAGLQNQSGMYGIGEYVTYAGYGSSNLYNQFIDGLGNPYGFTFAQYKAEIDAGRPVMIHVEGHSMYGYGYDDSNSTVYVHDTWSLGEHSLTWGGSYSGLGHYGVTVLELTGGSVVPEPSALVALVSMGLMGFVIVVRRRRKRAA